MFGHLCGPHLGIIDLTAEDGVEVLAGRAIVSLESLPGAGQQLGPSGRQELQVGCRGDRLGAAGGQGKRLFLALSAEPPGPRQAVRR